MSVVREYEAFNERVTVSEKRFGKWATRMTGQYEYALDHIKQMAKNDSRDRQVYSSSHFAVDMMLNLILLGFMYAGWWYFEPFKYIDNLRQNSDMNFEIKKANEMTEKLSDVKGIDEIRDEILDIIKMIKNSSDYVNMGAKLYSGES